MRGVTFLLVLLLGVALSLTISSLKAFSDETASIAVLHQANAVALQSEFSYVRHGIGQLEGEVLDPVENAVPMARLLLVDARVADPSTAGIHCPREVRVPSNQALSVVADENGRFRLDTIKTGPWVVVSTIAGFMKQRSPPYASFEGERSAMVTLRLEPNVASRFVVLPIPLQCWIGKHALEVRQAYSGWWPADGLIVQWCCVPIPGLIVCAIEKRNPDGWPTHLSLRCPADGSLPVQPEEVGLGARSMDMPKGSSTLLVQAPIPFLKIEVESAHEGAVISEYSDEYGVVEFCGLRGERHIMRALFPGGRKTLPIGVALNDSATSSAEIVIGDGLYQRFAEQVVVACFVEDENGWPAADVQCVLTATSSTGSRYVRRTTSNEFGFCRFVGVPMNVEAEVVAWPETDGIAMMSVKRFNTCAGARDWTTIFTMAVASNWLEFDIAESGIAEAGGSVLVNLMSLKDEAPIVVYSSWWRPSGARLEFAAVPQGSYWCELTANDQIVHITEQQTTRTFGERSSRSLEQRLHTTHGVKR